MATWLRWTGFAPGGLPEVAAVPDGGDPDALGNGRTGRGDLARAGLSAVALPIGLGCALVFGAIAVMRFRWEAD